MLLLDSERQLKEKAKARSAIEREQTIKALLERLGTTRTGLAGSEAERRRRAQGDAGGAPHRLAKLVALVRVAVNPLAAILLVAAAASAIAGELTNAAIIAIIVSLSGGIALWQKAR